MPIRKRAAGAGLEVAFELRGFFPGGEGAGADKSPGSESGSVGGAGFVVLDEAGREIAGETDVSLLR